MAQACLLARNILAEGNGFINLTPDHRLEFRESKNSEIIAVTPDE